MTQARDHKFSVFVVMPYDKDLLDVYELGIKAACDAVGAECVRVDEQIFHQPITAQIHSQIEAADVVVAEVSQPNPNVYYETGYAHGRRKPVVLLAKSTKRAPFDLRGYQHIEYKRSISTLRTALERALTSLRDSPVEEGPSSAAESATDHDLDRMGEHIRRYLQRKSFTVVSFAGVRRYVHPSYTDAALLRLIEERPSEFRLASLGANKPGIASAERSGTED